MSSELCHRLRQLIGTAQPITQKKPRLRKLRRGFDILLIRYYEEKLTFNLLYPLRALLIPEQQAVVVGIHRDGLLAHHLLGQQLVFQV